RSPTCWHWIVGIVDITIRRLFPWYHKRQDAIASEAARFSAAVQIDIGIFRARERPFVFITPAVGTHHKQPDWWFVENAIIYALQKVVEPPQLQVVEFNQSLRSKVDFTGPL